MLRKLYVSLLRLRTYEKLLKVPRQYANRVHLAEVDPDSALVMGRSAARSPANVKRLMKLYNVKTVEELLPYLPDYRYKRRPFARFVNLLRQFSGALPYNPDVSRYRMLQKRGYFSRPDIQERRAKVREYEG